MKGKMQLVNDAHEGQISLTGRSGQVVDRRAARAQQIGLFADAQGVVTVDHCLRSAIPLW